MLSAESARLPGLFLKIGETGEIYDLTVSGNIQSGGDCEAVGGIVGSGLERGAEDTSSTVTGCCSMVRITDCEQYSGAIAGRNAGEFLENPFVSDTLAGIDGQSYGGKAEPIGYDALLETEHLPDEFRTLTLRFEADDAVLTQETFSYGDSFDESVYPELPQKDGYYAQWDKTELEDLRFDTVVSAVYTPYTTAVSAGVRRDNGQDVFLIESDYDDAAQFSAQALAKSTEDFAPISRGFTSAISHYLKSVSWYRLPFTPINRDVEEQWRLTPPARTAARRTRSITHRPKMKLKTSASTPGRTEAGNKRTAKASGTLLPLRFPVQSPMLRPSRSCRSGGPGWHWRSSCLRS